MLLRIFLQQSQRRSRSGARIVSSSSSSSIGNGSGLRQDVPTNALRHHLYSAESCPSVSRSSETADSTTSSNKNAFSASQHQELVRIPSQPYVGSMDPSFSGISIAMDKPFTFWPEMRAKFGNFYSLGFPGIGSPKTDHSTVYVLTDPFEAMKVVRAAGNHPSGFIETMWPTKNWMDKEFQAHAIFSSGPEWRRLRQFFQTDLLHPKSARGYSPGILQAAQLASQGAPASSSNLNDYFNRCSFDMFSSVMFGEMTQVADPNTPTDPDNERFIRSAVTSSSTSIGMVFDGNEYVQKYQHGITTEKGKLMQEATDTMWEIGQAKMDHFLANLNTLTDFQQHSYLARALERQKSQQEEGEGDSEVSRREMLELAFVGFFAAVDTTSAVLGWNTLHLARDPRIQQKVYEEVLAATGPDGKLTPASVVGQQSSLPYLNMVIRETQRMTPPFPMYFLKEITGVDSLTLHNVTLEAGEKVIFEGYSICQDPTLVDDPTEFRPERWSADAVQAREGTPSEVLDHPFLRDAFSQTARRCPGSRVARGEIQAMLAQLVLDWDFCVEGDPAAPLDYHQMTAVEANLPTMHFTPRSS